ncbi:MAG: chemotaxis protein CheA [Sandaracinaceae bacterium]
MIDGDDGDRLREEVLAEARALLAGVVDDLAALDRAGPAASDPDLVHRMFRGVHTLKGIVGLVGGDGLTRAAHGLEDLLDGLRRGDLDRTAEVRGLLHEGVELIGRRLGADPPGVEDDLRTFEAAVGASRRSLPSPPPSADLPLDPDLLSVLTAAEEHRLRRQLQRGVPVYRIRVRCPLADIEARIDTWRRRADGLGEVVTTIVRGADPDPEALLLELVVASPAPPGELRRRLAGHGDPTLLLLPRPAEDGPNGGAPPSRLRPLRPTFDRIGRGVERMARALGKEVRYVAWGGETLVDAAVSAELFDPLVHLARNALDHGIEGATARARAGKPSSGLLTVGARRDGGRVLVQVADDGAGMDPHRIAASAVRVGAIRADALEGLTRQERIDLIFLPGGTTASCVTSLSGRGVGMDAVRARLAGLGGTARVESELGIGSTVTLGLPAPRLASRAATSLANRDRIGG